jgi:hypothetical protein
MNISKKEQVKLMLRNSTHIPKGNSNTPILKYLDGNIKKYDILKSELQDYRFQELEKLKNENPNYNYFYVDNIDNPRIFKELGTYDGISISYPNTNNAKYTLRFNTPLGNINDVVDIGGPLLLGTGEIFCIDKPKIGGKQRKSKRRKSKRRKSNKRRNTKRRYRK